MPIPGECTAPRPRRLKWRISPRQPTSCTVEEEAVFADAGYTGAEKHAELKDRKVKWHIAAKRGTVAALPEGEVKALTKRIERRKAKVRSRVEHVFHILKDRFHYRKLRYQGLKKNGAQHEVLFALANLIITKKALLAV